MSHNHADCCLFVLKLRKSLWSCETDIKTSDQWTSGIPIIQVILCFFQQVRSLMCPQVSTKIEMLSCTALFAWTSWLNLAKERVGNVVTDNTCIQWFELLAQKSEGDRYIINKIDKSEETLALEAINYSKTITE